MSRVGWRAWAAAVPAIVLAAGTVLSLTGRIFGGGLWPPDAVTLPEAVATGNPAEVVRLVSLGASPNAGARVRAEVAPSPGGLVTPLTMAILERRSELVPLLLDLGARPTSAEARGLRCLAQATPSSSMSEVVTRLGLDGPIDCP